MIMEVLKTDKLMPTVLKYARAIHFVTIILGASLLIAILDRDLDTIGRVFSLRNHSTISNNVSFHDSMLCLFNG